MSRRCEPERLPLNPGFAPDMIMLAMLAMIMLAAPSNTLLTLVALACPVPLLVAGSGGDSSVEMLSHVFLPGEDAEALEWIIL